jgi:hypothetical protein
MDENQPHFWVCYGLVAYQPENWTTVPVGPQGKNLGDGDPNAVEAAPLAYAGSWSSGEFYIFYESYRENGYDHEAAIADFPATAWHEISHLFGTDDIWDATNNYVEPERDGQYTPLTLRIIRKNLKGKPVGYGRDERQEAAK